MSFYEKVYDVVSKVPSGKVTTYGAVAKKLNTRAFRAVGTAMNKNPFSEKVKGSIYVPCHRVVCSDGRVGGFATGSKNKIAMLRREGVNVQNGKIDLKKFQHTFS